MARLRRYVPARPLYCANVLPAVTLTPGVMAPIAGLTGTTHRDAGGLQAILRISAQASAASSELRLVQGLVRRIPNLISADGQLPVYSGSVADAAAISLARKSGTVLSLGSWGDLAACRTADPDLFFPVSAKGRARSDIARALAVCASCPARSRCLDFALTTRQADGIWGGRTAEERHDMLGRPHQAPGAA